MGVLEDSLFALKRSTIINFWLLYFYVLLFVFHKTEAITVLNPTIESPIYKGNQNYPIIAFECNVVWGTEYGSHARHSQ